MSRLLFAAARGARIQGKDLLTGWLDTDWLDTDWVSLVGSPIFRIHPDDEHLQYGPISTALRGEAIESPWNSSVAVQGTYGNWAAYISTYLAYKECSDELHRSLFLLILSEALADEGL